MQFDAALLRLSEDAPLNRQLLPVCISSVPDENFVGKLGEVSGWGQLDHHSEEDVSPLLNTLAMRVMQNMDCRLYLSNIRHLNTSHITDNIICAVGEEFMTGVTRGDSGGNIVKF